MTPQPMTEHELREALDRLGSDLSRWPAKEAERARRCIEASPAAARMHAEAATVARWLDDALVPAPLAVPELRRTLLRRVAESSTRSARAMAWLLAGLSEWTLAWRPALVALVPLLLGFGIGFVIPEPDAPDTELAGAVSLYALSETTFEEYRDAP